MNRSLYAILNSRTAWCHQVALTDEALQLWEYQTLMEKILAKALSC